MFCVLGAVTSVLYPASYMLPKLAIVPGILSMLYINLRRFINDFYPLPGSLDLRARAVPIDTPSRIAVVSADSCDVRLLDATSGDVLGSVLLSSLPRLVVAFPNSLCMLVTTVGDARNSKKPTMAIIDTVTAEIVHDVKVGHVTAMAVSPNKEYVAYATVDKGARVNLVKLPCLEPFKQYNVQVSSTTALEFTPSSHQLIGALSDRMFALWNVPSMELVHMFGGPSSDVTSIVFLSANLIASQSGTERCARVWDVHSGRRVKQIDLEASPATVFSNPSRSEVMVASGNSLLTYDLGSFDVKSKVLCPGKIACAEFNGKETACIGLWTDHVAFVDLRDGTLTSQIPANDVTALHVFPPYTRELFH